MIKSYVVLQCTLIHDKFFLSRFVVRLAMYVFVRES